MQTILMLSWELSQYKSAEWPLIFTVCRRTERNEQRYALGRSRGKCWVGYIIAEKGEKRKNEVKVQQGEREIDIVRNTYREKMKE